MASPDACGFSKMIGRNYFVVLSANTHPVFLEEVVTDSLLTKCMSFCSALFCEEFVDCFPFFEPCLSSSNTTEVSTLVFAVILSIPFSRFLQYPNMLCSSCTSCPCNSSGLTPQKVRIPSCSAQGGTPSPICRPSPQWLRVPSGVLLGLTPLTYEGSTFCQTL